MLASQLILVVVALAVLLAVQGLYYVAVYAGQRQRAELVRRLRSVAAPGADQPALLRERRIARTPGLDRFLRPFSAARRLEKLLQQTDLPWTVATVLGLSIAAAVGLTLLLFFFVFRGSPWLALMGIPLGLLLPTLVVLNARIKRSQKISAQLPDALEMMMRSLQAGHGISAAFKLVAEEMPTPVAVEFARCFEEQRFGVDFREAVEHMTERVPGNLDLKILAVSVIIQRETGGNLVEVLDKIASTVRERYKFYGKLRALTAEGKASGYVLGGLPFLCLGAVYVFNPSYMEPMVTDPIGQAIGVGGLAIWLLGALWMSRMVNVDY
jgi:tight adherence protein B